ncbi:MAG: nucleotidyltransferase family protein [Candidatus Marinimicrobia bacterium]|nr:nucleotidyltransferase family protein [Candidatus Neomarinimicrobiota bacterium]
MNQSQQNDPKYYLKYISRLSMKTSKLTDLEIESVRGGYAKLKFDEIHEFGSTEKILPFIAHLLVRAGVEIPRWEVIRSQYEERNLEILGFLEDAFAKFDQYGIKRIFVYENFGALLKSGQEIACFASGDIDLYADYSEKEDISSALQDCGFMPKASTTVRTVYHSPTVLDGEGFRLNVMWQPLSRKKLPFPLDLDKCIEWDSLDTYKDTHIKIPSLDALLYLCLLHISVHGYHRSPDMRLYTDVERLAVMNPDWDKIAAFARHDKTEVRTATAALLTKMLLDIPLSDSWIDQYRSKYTQINRLVDRVYDMKCNYLAEEPFGLKVLVIEVFSADKHWISALFDLILPPQRWVRDYYLQGEGMLFKAYLMHIRNLVR